MKNILSAIFIMLFGIAYGQIDRNGNPNLEHTEIARDTIGNYVLTSQYLSIAKNISNKESAVFISENPSLDDYLYFARNTPSYTYLLTKDQEILASIILLQIVENEETDWIYKIYIPKADKTLEAECTVWGELTHSRAKELENLKVDKESRFLILANADLYSFNGIAYRIQLYNPLKREIMDIASKIVDALEKQGTNNTNN